MRWRYIDVFGNPVTCTVCKLRLDRPDYKDGIYYEPSYATEEDYEKISKIWQLDDPYVDFCVCERCVKGHCGAVPGLTADRWLAEHWEAYIQREREANELSKRTSPRRRRSK